MNNLYTIETKIGDEIEKALQIAISQRHTSIIKELMRFILNRTLNLRIQQRKNDFTLYLNIHKYIFQYLKENSVNPSLDKEVTKTLHDLICRSLKDLFDATNITPTKGERSNNLTYSQLIINSHGDLINLALIHHDLVFLRKILNNLHLIAFFPWQMARHLLMAIQQLEEKRDKTPQEEKELTTLKENYHIKKEVRMLLKATYFWALFLHGENRLTIEEIRKVIEIFDDYNDYIGEEFLPDLIYMRGFHNRQSFSWVSWDYIERNDMIVYTPPIAYNWELFGAAIFLIIQPGTLSLSSWKDQLLLNNNWAILHSLKQVLQKLKMSGNDKWSNLTDSLNKTEYENNINYLLNQINLFEEVRITEEERVIAGVDLDQAKVDHFINAIINGYRERNDLVKLFSTFNTIEILPPEAPTSPKKKIGLVNFPLIGSKKMFVSRENNGISVTGESQIMDLIQGREFLEFLGILPMDTPIVTSNTIDKINEILSALKENERKPTVIICGVNSLTRTFPSSESFDLATNESGSEIDLNQIVGYYQNIPVLRTYNHYFNDYILVADFEAAFKLTKTQAEKPLGLTANVALFTEEDIRHFLAQEDLWQRFGDDAEFKIKNSVKINYYVQEQFSIKDPNSFSLILSTRESV